MEPPCFSPIDPRLVKLLVAWDAHCSRAVEALVEEIAGNDPSPSIRGLCTVAMDAIRAAAKSQGVESYDMLGLLAARSGH